MRCDFGALRDRIQTIRFEIIHMDSGGPEYRGALTQISFFREGWGGDEV